ncbi:MAG: methyl-accepting chemotaxis protein [Pseudomonadota bacterium]
MKIGLKLILVSTIPTLVGLVVFSMIQVVKVDTLIDKQIVEVRHQQEESVIKKLKGQIDIALTLINNMRKEGKGRDECQEVIKNLRFGDGGQDYYWIHSFDPRQVEQPKMVMHPVLTSLDGNDISGFEDLKKFDHIVFQGKSYPKGSPELSSIPVTNLFVDMNKVVKTSGEGVVRYYWNKPGKEKNVAYSKFSYVKLIPEWGWVVGTGAYADHIDAVVAGLSEKLVQDNSNLTNTTLLVAGFLLLVLAGVSFYAARRLTRRIVALTNSAELMAKGDLTHQVQPTSKDELGQMAIAFQELVEAQKEKAALAKGISEGNLDVKISIASEADILGKSLQAMSASLNEVIYELNSAAAQMDEGSSQIAGSSQSLSQGATEQAAAIEEITSTMTEIGSQTKTNAENAAQASRLATTARDAGQRGTHQMDEMVQSMEAISESSKEIGKIIKAIDDIAFQTNLLALNAAVEAARAGKHGKGFAVVAQEVRTLAARSAKAAQETAILIETAVNKVEGGNQIAERTATALSEINQGIIKMADLVGNISAASNEQAQGISQVSQGLNQIDTVTQQNTASAEQTSAAAVELSSQAASVRKILSRFRVKRVNHQGR